ncbi:Hypothetical predicted protein [Marmota monax]|uniref:Uncharacterized protein n=1 Tax=Marmota monax TaxID=9995 RepID=A0A5E4D048_MARMO|nr:hypothetical protein GHT09_018352 [Marmota monax]VTJ86649.1 Hypothetical predicted protein [Marmota monax]
MSECKAPRLRESHDLPQVTQQIGHAQVAACRSKEVHSQTPPCLGSKRRCQGGQQDILSCCCSRCLSWWDREGGTVVLDAHVPLLMAFQYYRTPTEARRLSPGHIARGQLRAWPASPSLFATPRCSPPPGGTLEVGSQMVLP